ncbi:hypothetical protein D3C78_1878440 [compost metagenome]
MRAGRLFDAGQAAVEGIDETGCFRAVQGRTQGRLRRVADTYQPVAVVHGTTIQQAAVTVRGLA